MPNDQMSFMSSTGERPLAVWNRFTSQLTIVQSDMSSAAKYLVEKTRSQALSGYDVNGTPFAAYSPGYQREKKQSNVDLTSKLAHTHMLDQLTANVQANPGLISIGLVGEAALRARVIQSGMTRSGRAAKSWIGHLRHTSHQKASGLKRQLKNRGHIVIIPPRKFLVVSPQDVQIMSELVLDSMAKRIKV